MLLLHVVGAVFGTDLTAGCLFTAQTVSTTHTCTAMLIRPTILRLYIMHIVGHNCLVFPKNGRNRFYRQHLALRCISMTWGVIVSSCWTPEGASGKLWPTLIVGSRSNGTTMRRCAMWQVRTCRRHSERTFGGLPFVLIASLLLSSAPGVGRSVYASTASYP